MSESQSESQRPDEFATRLSDAAGRVFAGTPIFLAYAHGSRVCGGWLPGSDLDIGYYLESYRERGCLPIADEMALAARLSELLKLDLDLRNLGLAPLELRGRVLEKGVRIYSRDEILRVSLERDLLGRYHDYKEKFRRFHEERLRHFADSGLDSGL